MAMKSNKPQRKKIEKPAKSPWPGAEAVFALDRHLTGLWNRLLVESDSHGDRYRALLSERRKLALEWVENNTVGKLQASAIRECATVKISISEYRSILERAFNLAGEMRTFETAPDPGPPKEIELGGDIVFLPADLAARHRQEETGRRLHELLFEFRETIDGLRFLRDDIATRTGRARSVGGRPQDKQKPRIIATARREREKGTPWKKIREIVKAKYGGKTLSVTTLMGYVRARKVLEKSGENPKSKSVD
jgi:hypothetical protein